MTFTTEKYCQHRCDEIIDCWNQSLPYDPISKDRFMHMIVFDQNFDQELALTALLDNKVIGFCLGMKRKYPYLTRGLEPERPPRSRPCDEQKRGEGQYQSFLSEGRDGGDIYHLT